MFKRGKLKWDLSQQKEGSIQDLLEQLVWLVKDNLNLSVAEAQ